MSYWSIILISVVVILFIAFIRRAMKGVARNIDQLKYALKDLLRRGYNGGILIFEHVNSKRFVQFNKYILKKGEYGLQLSFPKAKWSENYFDAVRNYCDKESIRYDLVTTNKSDIVFLDIDLKKDLKFAESLTKIIFLDIFGIPDSELYYVKLEHAAIKDVLIDEDVHKIKD